MRRVSALPAAFLLMTGLRLHASIARASSSVQRE
jgi:hypothetical protein